MNDKDSPAKSNTKVKKKIKKAVTSRTGRFVKLAGMTASVAGRYASQRAQNLFASEEKSQQSKSRSYGKMADDIVGTLGELKGAVMKLGQIASQTQDFLPREFSEALQRLQKEAPSVDYSIIEQQIIDELGDEPENLFRSFDAIPFASASIGQVHRAVTLEGREVVVKIQYPGVDKSCDSDLKQLRLTLKLGGLLKIPKKSVDALFAEVRDRLHEELDYVNEAENLRTFGAFHKNHAGIIIPEVIPELSTRRVLTLEYVAGDDIYSLENKSYDQDTINLIGHRMFRMLAEQLFHLQKIHGDPHPGNFAFRPDGTVIVYDFGCVKKLKPAIVEAYKRAIICALDEDYEQLDQAMKDLGVRVRNMASPGADYYAQWRNILFVPFLGDLDFDYGEADIHIRVARETPSFFKHIDRFRPPVESLYIDRMVGGHYWLMKRLGVRAAFRRELEPYLGQTSRDRQS
jgi:predicted unusual protein kinase regulating ubiquinone biosynthesis (AarF/ABC1/UbiB family)